ncbi:MAG: DUF3189 family protein [Clostridiaceae bacterium]|nr:DUF3189 family protein [Clostridiaceae bacterium]
MKIIYAYKKNIYAALKAAYLHLKLQEDGISRSKEALEKMHHQIKPHYIGLDENLNEVYVANYGRKKEIFNNVIKGLGNMYEEEVEIINLTKEEEQDLFQ